jgi:CheY-like chemotaxis protein
VRVLLLEDNAVEVVAIQRELTGSYDLRVVGTLGDGLALLAQPSWRPEVIVADLNFPDSEGLATLHALQVAAPAIPVVISTGTITDTVRRQVEAWRVLDLHDRQGVSTPPSPGELALHHGQHPAMVSYRIEMVAEIDRVTRKAADIAVSRAIEQLLHRLGLEDEEGVRMAIRLARGWEAAKIRFLSAITTGIAAAFLLAVGAGIVAMLRQGGSK